MVLGLEGRGWPSSVVSRWDMIVGVAKSLCNFGQNALSFEHLMSLHLLVFICLKRRFSVAALCACGLLPSVWAEVPLLQERQYADDPAALLALECKSDAADQALQSGLVVVAEDLYRELLAVSPIAEVSAAEVRVSLAAALIAQQRFEAAGAVLEEIPAVERSDVFYLYRAVGAYGDGANVDVAHLNAALERVSVDRLSSVHRPWFYLLQGLSAELGGQAALATAAFEQALAVTSTEAQQAFFASLILRQEMLKSPADESLAAEIRVQLERLQGTAAAYPYAREYAILLYSMGRVEEALAVLDRELANARAGYGSREREQLFLLKGMLLGGDSAEGRAALRELVRSGQSREVMAIALQLLVRYAREPAELAAFLNEMIARSEPHLLLGQMYYVRSQIALANDQADAIALAEADAQLLLEQFPGLSEITNVYRLLAYAALQRSPPQYRTAADILIQLRDQASDPTQLQALNRWIGDCYFLNEDYRNAVDFYQAARGALEGDGSLFLRLITAELRNGQIDAALQHLDEATFAGRVSLVDRWRAEWNVAQALQATGALQQALQRVRVLLKNDSQGAVPTALDLRLRWLEARLSLVAEEVDGLGGRVNGLLLRIESLPEGTFSPAEAHLLWTEVLLLQADVLIRSGDSTAGLKVLTRLRNEFTQSAAAERSYLTEANYLAGISDFEAAQAALVQLASIYPNSELAPQALYEAALYCERRGAEYFADAFGVYHDLIKRYALDPLCFFARLKRGDLLRQMNDFAGAQIIYEDLINTFPGHPRRYLAELSRADCMLALAQADGAQLSDVALALERLVDMPGLPVDFQVEAGYKWAFALMQRDARSQAQTVLTLVLGRFLLDGDAATRLGPTGRYWMSRALLDLGGLLEQGGELAEARRLYRKMVAYNLPGRHLAQSRVKRLPIVE
jgi:hypothetical protein